jgi:hypothetical protein
MAHCRIDNRSKNLRLTAEGFEAEGSWRAIVEAVGDRKLRSPRWYYGGARILALEIRRAVHGTPMTIHRAMLNLKQQPRALLTVASAPDLKRNKVRHTLSKNLSLSYQAIEILKQQKNASAYASRAIEKYKTNDIHSTQESS